MHQNAPKTLKKQKIRANQNYINRKRQSKIKQIEQIEQTRANRTKTNRVGENWVKLFKNTEIIDEQH